MACISALVLGCTSKSPAPSRSPTFTPSASTTPTTITTPSTATSTPLPASLNNSVTPTPPPNNSSYNASNIDESLLNISGEQDESLPEGDIPTPDAGQ